MGHRDVVVMGASAGGVEALSEVVAGLPADLAAVVLVVLHVPFNGTSVLPNILARAGALPARHAVDGDTLQPGQILVAPPGYHLLVDGNAPRLSRGPRENGHRPAVDPLFRSAAHWHGARTIGVVLSGALDDGTAGLVSVSRHHGVAIVQDPTDAMYDAMPLSAARHVPSARVSPAGGIGALISRLVTDDVDATGSMRDALRTPDHSEDHELTIASLAAGALQSSGGPQFPAGFSCPDCNGTLFELDEAGLRRFRCRVGHAWSAQSLLDSQGDELEMALWTALRSLEDKAALCHRLADPAHDLTAARAEGYADTAAEAERAALTIRGLLLQRSGDDPALFTG